MNEPYDMLSVAFIRAWLRRYVRTGMGSATRPGVTLGSVAAYTGIPRNSLLWLALKETASVSPARQMLLSKTIAEIENGQIVFEIEGARKVARRVTSPKPIARYGFKFAPGGPRLVALGRPKPFRAMPTFKEVMLK